MSGMKKTWSKITTGNLTVSHDTIAVFLGAYTAFVFLASCMAWR